jgi:hypothetical protein
LCAQINMTHLRVVSLNRGADKGDPVARGSDVVRLRDSTNVDVVLLLTAVNLSFATQAVSSPDAPSGSLAVHRLVSGGEARREGLLPGRVGSTVDALLLLGINDDATQLYVWWLTGQPDQHVLVGKVSAPQGHADGVRRYNTQVLQTSTT